MPGVTGLVVLVVLGVGEGDEPLPLDVPGLVPEPDVGSTVLDEQAQATFVADCVLEARERGVDLRRQAVLFRNADHSDVLELELMRRNIPFVKYGGLKFLEAAHVKDLLALLRQRGDAAGGDALQREAKELRERLGMKPR